MSGFFLVPVCCQNHSKVREGNPLRVPRRRLVLRLSTDISACEATSAFGPGMAAVLAAGYRSRFLKIAVKPEAGGTALTW